MISFRTNPDLALLILRVLFCDMFVATMLVHLRNGWLGQGGMELTAVLGAAALALALAGAGRYSVDGAMASRRAAPVAT